MLSNGDLGDEASYKSGLLVDQVLRSYTCLADMFAVRAFLYLKCNACGHSELFGPKSALLRLRLVVFFV